MAVAEKSPEAFRTISEAADAVGAPAHVLRFWETRFSFIRPMKRAGGRRFYRPQDIEVLRGIRILLQDEGYTIKGVQRLHREGGVRRIAAAARGESVPPPLADDLEGEGDPPLIPVTSLGRLHAVMTDLDAAKARIEATLKE